MRLLSTLSTSLHSFISATTTPVCQFTTRSKMESSINEYPTGTLSIAYVTAPNDETAKKIGRGLVENKLAACVNIVPQITSIYEWKDTIEMDSEVLMMIKTKTSILEEMTKFVRENHPYDVCEVITLPIQGGNLPYLQWIGKVVKEK